MTSPTCTPIRVSTRSSDSRAALAAAWASWIACAQRMALMTLSNSPNTESPAVSTTRPWCASTRPRVRSWNSRISAVVPSSFRPIMRLKPATSTMRMAASLRRGVEDSMAMRGRLSHPQPRRVDGEAQAEADEPRVVVQTGPEGRYVHRRHGGEEPGQTGRDADGERDEGGEVKAPAIPVGAALAVEAGDIQAGA